MPLASEHIDGKGSATYSESDVGRKESGALVSVERGVYVSALNNVLLSSHGLEEGVSEDSSG